MGGHLDIREHIAVRDAGMVYCITAPTMKVAKIGFWRRTIEGLLKRYVTPYGKEVSFYYVNVDACTIFLNTVLILDMSGYL